MGQVFRGELGIPGVPPRGDIAVGGDAKVVTWSLQCAAYNCDSLRSGAVRAEVDIAFDRAQAHVVGFQETRVFRGQKSFTKLYEEFLLL